MARINAMRVAAWLGAGAGLLPAAHVLAATADTQAVAAPVAQDIVMARPLTLVAAPDCHCVIVPALTPVELEILAPVGSKTSKTGDRFPLRLARPVLIAGREVLPAGLMGVGEVVHAKPSGGGGGGGELVLAARYLDVANGRIRLRSMRVSSVGKDQTGLAMASAYALGPLAIMIKGKNTEIAAGALAEARIAQDFAAEEPKVADVGTLAALPREQTGSLEERGKQ